MTLYNKQECLSDCLYQARMVIDCAWFGIPLISHDYLCYYTEILLSYMALLIFFHIS